MTTEEWVRLRDALSAETAVLRGENDYLLRDNTARLRRIEQLEAALRQVRPWIARPHIEQHGRVALLTRIDALLNPPREGKA